MPGPRVIFQHQLQKRRKTRKPPRISKPELTIELILSWADAFNERTGRWPGENSGQIPESVGDKWSTVTVALQQGHRGLEKGNSLARLLEKHRGVRNRANLPPFTISKILSWADAHFKRYRRWPTYKSGPIKDAPGETWNAVQVALDMGGRGLPGGSSLARFLEKHRGVRNRKNRPRFSVPQILRWADAHFKRTGQWPTHKSGTIVDAPDETWEGVTDALHRGCRGLPGGSSVAQVLAEHRGVRNSAAVPQLTTEMILTWADVHQRRTGEWPHFDSGPITDAPDETWNAVQVALQVGLRGLDGGSTLARLLAQERGVRNNKALPPLRPKQILRWADVHHRRTGKWPVLKSGAITDAPGETWQAVQAALVRGARGLPGGSSLAQFLAENRGVRNPRDLPPLTKRLILKWVDAHHKRLGAWPKMVDGPILDAPGETWLAVDASLRRGKRGLPGGSSLSLLLEEHGRG
jgi:hypothetical protein